MICNNCGKEIDDDAEFCYFCGGDTANTASVEFEEVGLFDKDGGSESSFGDTVDNLRNLMFANSETEIKEAGADDAEIEGAEIEGDEIEDAESDEEATDSVYAKVDEYNLAGMSNLTDMSNLTGVRCHLCGSKVIPGEIKAYQGRDVFDIFADGTFIRDDEEVGILGPGGMRIHLSGPACFCPKCRVVTGFFKAN